jgi:N-acetylneuraminate synthase
MYKLPIVIAEIGCNHMGDINIAKEMIMIAKTFCKVDYVKFQKRDVKFWSRLKPEIYNNPHPDPKNAFGNTYLEHRKYLEFNRDQHYELKKFAEEIGISYSCSVWDLKSAKDIVSLSPKIIKVPSASNNYFEMLDYICSNFAGEIHISLGMSTKQEIDDIVNFFIERKRNKDLVLYHCVSGYPIKFKDTYLLEIKRLLEKYGDKIKDIGYSGHHLGIAIDIAAYTLGAVYIERHFTLDRTWKGTDHAASLEPDGLRRLKRDLMATYESLKYKEVDILDFEQEQKKKLKYFGDFAK